MMKGLKPFFVGLVSFYFTTFLYASPVGASVPLMKKQLPVQHANAVAINEVDANALAAAIKGLGKKRAQSIVAYRNEHGSFHSADELINVSGISCNLAKKIQSKVNFSG